ncbi:2-dehydro-3-deoxyphosphogluconate aldolase/(4S)-4-hydroxy-2-oxoglutarate aldolase [Microbacterium phyllosphaerae]|uniref:2-dehydro-3-deoxyphosphogluconate aldolase/(4S)-4-hydroxy-2-oxoglutarate aldolase n=1 Tax=Microbacterium phyllosphaerae TaxID=124798 RepID=A0ABS4WNP0_9MICO|nr:bifunctional 4-hydroxy-2-oxoglutarate aldolase/2-dehydro-3-deoxy-phosphogluconate aldolase [Microbacterium phyllosphaerae]MBP2377825.1 2-dehydro-3-deoxyphosphogluconate aldolase/(4S)-4-hydroxy-2-oxoglutarate aldolase [Microbacterium phyllosphaerae]
MTARLALPHVIERDGIVAVLRAPDADAYLAACQILMNEGINAIELTLTTPGTLRALPYLRAHLPEATIGVGTALTGAHVNAAIDAGAEFIVTPIADPQLVDAAIRRGTPIIPGAFTPTEVHAVWAAGASAVKIFPAATVGADYLRQLAGPFPELTIMPSGGVGLDDIPYWIGAGAVAVSLGGPLLGDSLVGGDLRELATRAQVALTAVASARTHR